MTVTYFFMLLFVFITLFVVGARWITAGDGYEPTHNSKLLAAWLALLWASLGTFFFYNIW